MISLAAVCAEPLLLDQQPQSSLQQRYAKTLLRHAYQRLGYQLEFQSMPYQRGLLEAKFGRIDGLLARPQHAVQHTSTLMPVDIPLYQATWLLLVDQRRCADCKLVDLTTLVMITGTGWQFGQLGQHHDDLRLQRVSHLAALTTMLQKQQVMAALVMDDQLPQGWLATLPEWRAESLNEIPVYHYLHLSHHHLLQPLAETLQGMKTDGSILRLRQHFGLPRQTFNHDNAGL